MKNEISLSSLSVGPDIALYHTGPALASGPLPSLFYLALSGPASLTVDPFNQPVQFLQGSGQMIRIFSMTLPGHEGTLPPSDALRLWAEDLSRGIDCMGQFLDAAQMALDFAIGNRFADPDRIAFAGLSRGGLLAAHLAARYEKTRLLLAFAPVTKLGYAKEFSHLKDHPAVTRWDLENLSEPLSSRHVRLYIGNRDTRVGTRLCFEFAMHLVEKAHEKKIRTPPIELFITPSIGQMGHGTSPEIFQQGAHWIAESL